MSTEEPENPNAEEMSKFDASLEQFLTTLAINSAIALVFVTLYFCLRGKNRHIYVPKLFLTHDTLEELPAGVIGWASALLKVSDDAIFEHGGIDALVVLRFFRLVFKITAVFSVYGLGCLIPIYATGGNGEKGLTLLSIANVQEGDARLWASIVGAYIVTFLVLYGVLKEYQVYGHYRNLHLTRSQPSAYSVLIMEIPKDMRTNVAMFKLMDKVFPGQVKAVHMVVQKDDMAKLVKKHDALVIKYEAAQFVAETKDVRPQHREKLCGSKVDSLSTFQKQLDEMEDVMRKLQDDLKHKEATHACFVTFSHRSSALIASQLKVTKDRYNYDMYEAPETDDVIWKNLKLRKLERLVRIGLVTAATFFLVVFWLVPVGFVSALINLENLKKYLPIEPLLKASPALSGFITGFLPTLALKLFFIILPILVDILTDLEGVWTKGTLCLGSLNKLYIFSIVNVLGITLGGSIINTIEEIIDDPGSIIDLLATSLPPQATFFMNYIMLNALSVFSGSLLRLGKLIVAWIKMKLAVTNRQKRDAWLPGDAQYTTSVSDSLLIFAIGVIYSCIAPLISVFVLLYFGFGYMVELHHTLYVYMPEFSTGGRVWTSICEKMMIGTVVFQLLMIGELTLKGKGVGSILLILPLALTIVFWYQVSSYYKPSATAPALESAVEQDKADENTRRVGVQNSIPYLHDVTARSAFDQELKNAYDQYSDPVKKHELYEPDTLPNPYDEQEYLGEKEGPV